MNRYSGSFAGRGKNPARRRTAISSVSQRLTIVDMIAAPVARAPRTVSATTSRAAVAASGAAHNAKRTWRTAFAVAYQASDAAPGASQVLASRPGQRAIAHSR